jgi:membrane-bound lytic murein transglycosylase D
MQTTEKKHKRLMKSLKGPLPIVLFLLFSLTPTYALQTHPSSYRAPLSSYPTTKESTDNLWDTLSYNLTLNHYANTTQVRAQIKWYMRHKQYLYRLAENASPYIYYILQQVSKRNLPAEMALVPFVESAYNPYAYSGEGAAGLWQMMPGTATGFGLTQNWWYDGRRDIVDSTKGALNYMAYLQNFFEGNWLLAMAAYNTGEGNILSSIHENIKHHKSTDFWSLPLSKQTKTYVPKILALAEILANPDEYPLSLPYVKNAPSFQKVKVGSQINLSTAATLAHTSLKELLKLNPGFKRWATAPRGKHQLLVPLHSVKQFYRGLRSLPKNKRVTWNRYRVKPGDTLSSIAKKHNTSMKLILALNKLHSHNLSPKQLLLIPLSSKSLPAKVFNTAQQYLNVNDMHHAGPQQIIHTVKHGDTMSRVSNRYHIRPRSILFWNKLTAREAMRIGTKLILWTPINYHNHALKTLKYLVKKGDSISSIAHRYHTNLAMIKKTNKLPSNLLKIHQKLTLIPHTVLAPSLASIRSKKKRNLHLTPRQHITIKKILYEVQQHDTLSEIAANFKIPIKNLAQWNPIIKKTNTIHPGDTLLIYT